MLDSFGLHPNRMQLVSARSSSNPVTQVVGQIGSAMFAHPDLVGVCKHGRPDLAHLSFCNFNVHSLFDYKRMEEEEETFIETLAKSYATTEDVPLDDIYSRPQSGTVKSEKLSWLKKSYISIGILPSSTLCLYRLSESQKEGSRYNFGVIDGAHRVIALNELRDEFPDTQFPKSFPARIYNNIEPLEIMFFSASLDNRKVLLERAPRTEE